MTKSLLAAVVFALTASTTALAEPPSETSVEILHGPLPQPVRAAGRLHLLYELRVTNLGQITRDLAELEVLDEKDEPLAKFRGAALYNMLIAVGGPPELAPKAHALAGGRAADVFLDLSLPSGSPAPHALHHALVLEVTGKDGSRWEERLTGGALPVLGAPPPLLRPPLRGSGWLAANGLSNPAHRRAIWTIDGVSRIAQRFAIDWVMIGPNGLPFHDTPGVNAHYYGYGAEVLAVADGRVAGIKDGIPENAGSNPKLAVPITLETIAGNHLILDLGGGRYALYAHLQPGSFKVKVGDRVEAGQALAKLGNSGHSDAPHLHFQVVDGDSNLAAEGVPYELESFSQIGAVQDLDAVMDGRQPWRGDATAPNERRLRELPADGAVVAFP
jgi:murein DD-endopeptidase MepM/ murein hydrolase activator NlpD